MSYDRRIGAAVAVMRSLYRSVMVKRELSRKAKLSIYWSIYVRTQPAEVARASILDAPWTPSSGGVPGMSRREETPRKTQDTLEWLCHPAGLGAPWDPPGGSVRGEGSLGVPAQAADFLSAWCEIHPPEIEVLHLFQRGPDCWRYAVQRSCWKSTGTRVKPSAPLAWRRRNAANTYQVESLR